MRRFLRAWLLSLVGMAVATVALTVGVDPYGVLGTPRVAGLTADKPAAADWPRLTKPYMVERVRPETILLGSSNVDVGMDPDSPAWPAALRPVFNLAIDGAGPQTQFEYLQHALARTAPKLVLMGVSFEDALAWPPDTGKRLSADVQAQWTFQARLRTRPDGRANTGYTLARLKDLAFATVSLKAVRDSVLTLVSQGDPGATYQTALGQNTGGKFGRWVATEGQYALFMDKERQKAPEFVRWLRHPMTDVGPVGDAIRLAQSQGARVIVYVIPSHAEELEMFRQLGMTPYYQAWKAELAAVVETAAAPGNPVTLWDFGGFSPYVTEAVPGPGDTRNGLRWIWEPIHFRPELGALMAARMVGEGGPVNLGVQVTAAEMPGRAAAYAEAQRAWVAAHPADVARIAGLVAGAVEAVCHTTLEACMAGGRPTASR